MWSRKGTENSGPVMDRNPVTPDRRPMRCDHCRKPFRLVLHRYFRMRFCSPGCLKAYQERLNKLTCMKIEQIDPVVVNLTDDERSQLEGAI